MKNKVLMVNGANRGNSAKYLFGKNRDRDVFQKRQVLSKI